MFTCSLKYSIKTKQNYNVVSIKYIPPFFPKDNLKLG